MALNYNLSKVYALAEEDSEFVNEILRLFLSEVPEGIVCIKEGIQNKNYRSTYDNAHKIKPTLDLLGLNMAYQDILLIEEWTVTQGKKKQITDTFDNLKKQVENAIKEIKKDFNLNSITKS
jgi:HPt (histidine-containing phosphotransfer) domain-containing protein